MGLGVRKQLTRGWLFFEWLAVSALERARPWPKSREGIVFTLDNDRLYRDGDGSGRYAYLILNLFSEAGYAVYLHKKIDFAAYIKLGKYGRGLYGIKNLRLIRRLPIRAQDMTYAFDDETDSRGFLKHVWRKLLYVNVLKDPQCKVGETIWIPYFMHMRVVELGCAARLAEFRRNPKKLRAFFGGNVAPAYYANPDLHRYGQPTRVEGMNALLSVQDARIRAMDDAKQFERCLAEEPYRAECLLLKTGHTFPIHPVRWLGIVSQSDFFVCLSGTDLPMCHHAIEALAVGTVPIISYPDWFYPPLEHRKNALVYSGVADLAVRVREALDMSKDEILRMRKNAMEYYDRYLTHERFREELRRCQGGPHTIMLHPRLRPTDEEKMTGQELLHRLNSNLARLPR